MATDDKPAVQAQTIKEPLNPAFDLPTLIERAQRKPEEFVLPALAGAGGTILAMLLVFAAAQFWRQASDRFWRIVGWLGSFQILSPLALRAYRREVATRYGRLVNIYLGKEEELSLNQVFVPLTLRASGDAIDFAENRSTAQILTDAKQKRLLLLGAPGSGKSTLLKALAAGVSRREWPQFHDLVPVFVSLREYGAVADKTGLLDWLVEKELPRLGLRNPKPLLESLFAKGRVLLMLDGLDEVASERLDTVNRAISQFLEDLDNAQACRVLLTCREQNYDDLPDRHHYSREGFTEYRVADLRESEIREIVRRRQDSFTEKHKSMANYLEQVFRHSDILRLHRNPLLLTLSMGVYLHRPGEEVPHNLAQFYEQAIDNLLRRHDFREIAGRSANQFKAECKFRVLRHFALQNLIAATEAKRDFETFSFQAVKAAARELAEAGKVDFKPEQAHDVVKEIQLQAGLLNALEDGECFLFAHRSINEYCAAAALNRQNEAGFQRISEQLGNTGWRQVIFFYAAIDDDHDNAVCLVEAIKRQAVEKNDTHRLALAGHCAAVMVQPRRQLRLDVLEELVQALAGADDLAMRGVLLKSVMALGSSRDEEIRQKLDYGISHFVELGNAQQLLREIGRLELSAALQFLGYLADSGNIIRKRMALWGLSQLDSQDKIPILWRLLLDFDAQGIAEIQHLHNTLSQILTLMPEPGAVERLNECDLIAPINPEKRTKVAGVYPFLPDKAPVSAFVWVLYLARHDRIIASQAEKSGDPDWKRFLEHVLSRKDQKEQREWQRLPKDRNKWTPKIEKLLFGKALLWLPQMIYHFVLIFFIASVATESQEEAIVQVTTWYMILPFFSGLLVAIIWRIWMTVVLIFGDPGTLAAYPEISRFRLKSTLRINQNREANSGRYFFLYSLGLFTLPFHGCALAIAGFIGSTMSLPAWGVVVWWFMLFSIFFCLPSLSWFDPGRLIYPLGKPNRYLDLYQIPGVERWLPPEEKH